MLDYKDKGYGFDTLMVHAGTQPDPETNSVALPIYQTTAYTFDSAEHAKNLFNLSQPGNIYTRLMNPTTDALERRVAALDGGEAACAMASGHAIMFNSFLNLATTGDEIVSSLCIYGGAINMMGVTLKRIGINVKFVNPDDLDAWENAVTDKTRAFFVELIGNPNANIADLEAIANIAHKHGIPLFVDSTFNTPYLCRPIDFGADFVVHSATKFLGGHGNSMSGIVTEAGSFKFKDNPRFPLYNDPDPSYHGIVYADVPQPFSTRMRTMMMRDLGAVTTPFNSFMIMQGIETLSLRMKHLSDNTLALAQWLQSLDEVAFVNYPGLSDSPYYERAKKYMPKGAGAVFTFGLKGGREIGAKFIDSLKLIMHVTNVGDTRTLISHPASTTHSQLTDRQLEESGITPQTLRISLGLEDLADLKADIAQAIKCALA